MKTRERIPIASEKDLQAHAIAILRRINEAERGGLLFLLNPVYALEDVGFDISPAMRRHIRRGLRYGARTKARIREQEAKVAEIAGREVRAASDADVARLLFEELKLPVPGVEQAQAVRQEVPPREAIYEPEEPDIEGPEQADYGAMTVRELRALLQQRGLPQSGRRAELVERLAEDDRHRRRSPPITPELLERLRDTHPVVPRIMELRQLLQTGWRFVNRETYEKVKGGATVTLLRGVRFRRRAGPKTPCGGEPCR